MKAATKATMRLDLGVVSAGSWFEIKDWTQKFKWLFNSPQTQEEFEPWHLPNVSLSFLTKQAKQQGADLKIPSEILAAIASFEVKFESYSIQALWFAAQLREARELLLSNAFLVWVLLDHAKRYELSSAEVTPLFGLKRREILMLSGLEGAKSQVKTIQKMHLEGFKGVHLQYLAEFFHRHTPRQIGRFKNLSVPLLRLVSREHGSINLAFLHNLTLEEHQRIEAIFRDYEDTQNMLTQLNVADSQQVIARCQNPTQLRALHDRLIDDLNKKISVERETVIYPQPPVESSERFVHLANYKMLFAEGASQKHCIASYHSRVLSGDYFVYQYLGDETATIGIEKKGLGYSIDDIRLKCNGIPSNATKEAIYEWFANF